MDARADARDLALEREMATVQTIVGLGRQLRTDNNLKVRQPLSAIHAVAPGFSADPALIALVTDELNIKSFDLMEDETALADVSFKANFKTLGKRFGAKMKAVAAAIAEAKSLPVVFEGEEISGEDVIVRRTPKAGLVVATEGAVVAALETALTPELVAEGLGRELVSKIQAMRKDAGLEVTDRIRVTLDCDSEIKSAAETFREYIAAETLADEISFAAVSSPGIDINGRQVRISIAG